jgi:hypothetical protein
MSDGSIGAFFAFLTFLAFLGIVPAPAADADVDLVALCCDGCAVSSLPPTVPLLLDGTPRIIRTIFSFTAGGKLPEQRAIMRGVRVTCLSLIMMNISVIITHCMRKKIVKLIVSKESRQERRMERQEYRHIYFQESREREFANNALLLRNMSCHKIVSYFMTR